MRRAFWVAVVMGGSAAAALCSMPRFEASVPAGIILPVRLNNSISSKKAKTDQVFTARLMQNVPLPDRGRIREGARVLGHIVSVSAATPSSGARVSLKIDSLVVSGQTIPIRTSLRAIASPLEVEDAELPAWGADRGTSSNAYTTIQVGGEVVYRGGGHVMRHGEVVGEPVYDGVLARIRANVDGECRGAIDENEAPQALWLFSSDACGAYGFAGLEIVDTGRANANGEIVLATNRGNLNIRSGTGMLLRVKALKQ